MLLTPCWKASKSEVPSHWAAAVKGWLPGRGTSPPLGHQSVHPSSSRSWVPGQPQEGDCQLWLHPAPQYETGWEPLL